MVHLIDERLVWWPDIIGNEIKLLGRLVHGNCVQQGDEQSCKVVRCSQSARKGKKGEEKRSREKKAKRKHAASWARKGEVHGQHYYFIPKAEFLSMLETDQFIQVSEV